MSFTGMIKFPLKEHEYLGAHPELLSSGCTRKVIYQLFSQIFVEGARGSRYATVY
jgi:hypothetical protein